MIPQLPLSTSDLSPAINSSRWASDRSLRRGDEDVVIHDAFSDTTWPDALLNGEIVGFGHSEGSGHVLRVVPTVVAIGVARPPVAVVLNRARTLVDIEGTRPDRAPAPNVVVIGN